MYFNIKCIGKVPGPTNEFERSLVFETGEFERPKFDCTWLHRTNRPKPVWAEVLLEIMAKIEIMQLILILDYYLTLCRLCWPIMDKYFVNYGHKLAHNEQTIIIIKTIWAGGAQCIKCLRCRCLLLC